MSGTRRPSAVCAVVFSEKSQWFSMPASSTTRRSCTSPQPPLTCGVWRARSRLLVDVASVWSCSLSRASALARSFSTCCSLASTCPSVSWSGLTRLSIEWCRWSKSTTASFWNSLSDAFASCRNDWLLARKASAETEANASRRLCSACSSSLSRSVADRRSPSSSAVARTSRSASSLDRWRASPRSRSRASSAASSCATRLAISSARARAAAASTRGPAPASLTRPSSQPPTPPRARPRAIPTSIETVSTVSSPLRARTRITADFRRRSIPRGGIARWSNTARTLSPRAWQWPSAA